jgi:uncharacterized protein YqeY
VILDQFKPKLIEYAKAKDQAHLDVLRFFLAQVKNKEIEIRPQGLELNDEHVYKVLKKLLKQADQTIEDSKKANRPESAQKAEDEKVILQEFMAIIPDELKNDTQNHPNAR